MSFIDEQDQDPKFTLTYYLKDISMANEQEDLFGELNSPMTASTKGGIPPSSSNEPNSVVDNPFEGMERVPSPEEANSSMLESLMYSSEIDPEELAKKEAELFIPTGEYVWYSANKEKAALTVAYRTIPQDKDSRDITARKGKPELGRSIWNVYGMVKNIETGRTGRFSFQCSPDQRYRRDAQGNITSPPEVDQLSKTYATWSMFFYQKYERKPKNEGEVLDLIKSTLYSMRITQGQRGNFLGGVKSL